MVLNECMSLLTYKAYDFWDLPLPTSAAPGKCHAQTLSRWVNKESIKSQIMVLLTCICKMTVAVHDSHWHCFWYIAEQKYFGVAFKILVGIDLVRGLVLFFAAVPQASRWTPLRCPATMCGIHMSVKVSFSTTNSFKFSVTQL